MVVSALLNKCSPGTLVATIFKYFMANKDTAKYLVPFFFTDFVDFDCMEFWSKNVSTLQVV